MEELINNLKSLVNNDINLKIRFNLDFTSTDNYWALDIDSPYSENSYIFTEYGKDLKELLENGIKETKKFIDEFKWEE